MRRRLNALLVVLVLTMCFMAGCSKDPKKQFDKQIQNEVKTMADKLSSIYGIVASKSDKKFGYDTSIKLVLSEEMIENDELRNVSIDLATDYNNKRSSILANIGVNGDEVLDAILIREDDEIYFSLPKYTDSYIDVWEAAEEAYIEAPELPDSAEVKDMITDYGTTLLGAFQYTKQDKNKKVREQGISFDATVLYGECTVEDFKDTLEDVKDELKDSDLYKELKRAFEHSDVADYFDVNFDQDEDSEEANDDDDEIVTLKMYIGKKGNKGYEIVGKNKDKIGFITDGLSWAFYAEQDDEEAIIRNEIKVKDKEVSGEFYIGTEEENFELTYDNVVLKKNKIISFDYVLDYTYEDEKTEIAKGTYEKQKDTIHLTAELKGEDKKIGTLELKHTKRNAKAVTELPDDAPVKDSYSEWKRDFDDTKYREDLTEYEELRYLLRGSRKADDTTAAAPKSEDVSYTDEAPDYDYTEESNDAKTTDVAKNALFKAFSNYSVSDGWVLFEPSKKEVFEQNIPSTGLLPMSVDEAIADEIVDYLENTDIAMNAERNENDWFYVSGYEEEPYSYYNHIISYVDENKDDTFIEINYEAITGKLAEVKVSTRDVSEVERIATDLYNIVTGEETTGHVAPYEEASYRMSDLFSDLDMYLSTEFDENNEKIYKVTIE